MRSSAATGTSSSTVNRGSRRDLRRRRAGRDPGRDHPRGTDSEPRPRRQPGRSSRRGRGENGSPPEIGLGAVEIVALMYESNESGTVVGRQPVAPLMNAGRGRAGAADGDRRPTGRPGRDPRPRPRRGARALRREAGTSGRGAAGRWGRRSSPRWATARARDRSRCGSRSAPQAAAGGAGRVGAGAPNIYGGSGWPSTARASTNLGFMSSRSTPASAAMAAAGQRPAQWARGYGRKRRRRLRLLRPAAAARRLPRS